MPVIQPRNTHIQPRNTQTVDTARSMLSAITPMAQQQYNNALKVNGIQALIYSKMYAGRVCSCSNPLDVSQSAPVLDEQGNASQEHIHSLLTGSNVSIKRYGQRSSNTADRSTLLPNAHIDIEQHIITTDLADPVGETVYDDAPPIDEIPLGAGYAGRCAVCCGTGFVGGFQPHNGTLYTVDATFPTVFYKATRNQTVFPNTIDFLVDDASIEFSLILTKAAKGGVVRVFDGDTEVDGYNLLRWKNSAWVAFNPLDTSNYDGLEHKFKLTGPAGSITHLQLYIQQSAFELIEYPKLTLTGDLSVIEGIDAVSLNLGPTVASIQPWDIVVDLTYGKLWLITNSNPFNDANLRLHGWDCQARLVQPIEVFTTLYQPRLNLHRPSVVFNRRY